MATLNVRNLDMSWTPIQVWQMVAPFGITDENSIAITYLGRGDISVAITFPDAPSAQTAANAIDGWIPVDGRGRKIRATVGP